MPRARPENPLAIGLSPRVRLWVLRLLVNEGGGRPEVLRRLDAETRALVGASGPPPTRRRLRQLLAAAEKAQRPGQTPLERNVDALGAMLGLDAVERDVLLFATASHLVPVLADCIGPIRRAEALSMTTLTAAALGHPVEAVSRALDPEATLCATRLTTAAALAPYGGPLFEVPEHVLSLLSIGSVAPDRIAAEWVTEAPASALGADDFAHLEPDLTLCVRVLAGAIASGARGVNLLLHGPPGTGKTELSRVAARAAGATAMEVAIAKRDGAWAGGVARLGTYATAQRLLASRRGAVIVLDEIEDLFPSTPFRSDPVADKAWIHRLLETNATPAIWISNAIDDIDPAHLRRFSVVLEVPVPPLDVRRRVLGRAAASLPLRAACLDELAANPLVAPAHVDRAMSVVRLAGLTDPERVEGAVRRVITQALPTGAKAEAAPRAVGPYDLGAVRADVDLERLVATLARRPHGTMCLYGPPGTGKTAFAHHLATRLRLPLRVERASDLLGSFVGETERAIAKMFGEAARRPCVLFLDEADSMLRSRSTAHRGWEVTQVNELLVQMERFEGVFVCATNQIDALDPAAMRRFAVKVAFDYPGPEARLRLFVETLVASGGRAPEGADADRARARLARLGELAPGDFATVLRRASMLDEVYDVDRLIAALEAEIAARPSARRRGVGFRADVA